jgi:glutaminyl-tRNA synthetase
VKGTIHWVDAPHALPAEFRLYEPLILDEEMAESEDKTFLDHVNANSLEVINGFIEPNLENIEAQEKLQFFRHGYFNVDPKHSEPGKPVFNRIVSLKSSFKL